MAVIYCIMRVIGHITMVSLITLRKWRFRSRKRKIKMVRGRSWMMGYKGWLILRQCRKLTKNEIVIEFYSYQFSNQN